MRGLFFSLFDFFWLFVNETVREIISQASIPCYKKNLSLGEMNLNNTQRTRERQTSLIQPHWEAAELWTGVQWAWIVAWNEEVKSKRKEKKKARKKKARTPAATAFDFLILSVSEESRDGNEEGCTCDAVIPAVIAFAAFQRATKGQATRIRMRYSQGPTKEAGGIRSPGLGPNSFFQLSNLSLHRKNKTRQTNKNDPPSPSPVCVRFPLIIVLKGFREREDLIVNRDVVN